MVSKSKLYSRLDSLEDELRAILLPHLKIAAEGKNDLIFCVTAFNPFRELRHRTDKLTEELIDVGAQILALREKLEEPTEGTLAERICWYCREWSAIKNRNKSLTSSLAQQFLAEIESA